MSRKPKTPLGSVALVGTGPGDPELLTLRAVELLRHAEVVVGDLAALEPVVATHLPAGAERVDTAGEGLTVTETARLLARHAKEGRHVVRLFAGDPFVGCSGAEHAAGLAKAGLPFEVVPGVSAATAVPAYAGVPVTGGGIRETRTVEAAGKVDWAAFAAGTATLVVLGAEGRLTAITEALVRAGRDAATAAAVVSCGTTTAQRTVCATLADIAGAAHVARLDAPYTLVVGDLVSQRERLSWWETKPLFGWRVLVPRTKEQAGELSARLRSYGAVPEEVPTISVEPPRTPQQMEKAVRGLVEGRYEWVAFTSVNALRAVRERFEEYGLDARAFSGLKIAAVGERTAEALRGWGIVPDLVPSGEQSAHGLLEDWPAYDEVLDPINRVFLPRADIATETLVAGLHALGWEVDDVTAYRTVRAAPPAASVREAIKSGRFDAVVFTSSSTVRNLIGIAGKPHGSTVVACIGPQTAKTAEEHGLRVDVLADSPSVDALSAGLATWGATRRSALLEAGESVTRPSDRRRTATRQAT